MNWFYTVNGEQKGPVDQPEFERLIQAGVITEATLVWREGMTDWQPWRETAGPPVAAPPVGTSVGGIVCSECGHAFAADQVIRLGSGYVCAICKPVAVQKLWEGVNNSAAEELRKAHLNHEASVKSIGLLYLLGAAFMLLAGAAGLFASGTNSLIAGFVFLGLGGMQIWVGIGLRGLKPWARIPSGILSGLGLLAIPIGTLINGYILYLLFSKKGATVFSEDYRRAIAETPHIKYRTSIVIWILLGLVLLLVGVGLIVAFFAPRR